MMHFALKQLTVCVVSGDILSSFAQMVFLKFSAAEFVPETGVQPTHEWYKLDNRPFDLCCSHFKRPSPTLLLRMRIIYRALIAKPNAHAQIVTLRAHFLLSRRGYTSSLLVNRVHYDRAGVFLWCAGYELSLLRTAADHGLYAERRRASGT